MKCEFKIPKRRMPAHSYKSDLIKKRQNTSTHYTSKEEKKSLRIYYLDGQIFTGYEMDDCKNERAWRLVKARGEKLDGGEKLDNGSRNKNKHFFHYLNVICHP